MLSCNLSRLEGVARPKPTPAATANRLGKGEGSRSGGGAVRRGGEEGRAGEVEKGGRAAEGKGGRRGRRRIGNRTTRTSTYCTYIQVHKLCPSFRFKRSRDGCESKPL